MGTNKVSTLWTNFTNDIASITVPAVAWETIAKEVYQITPEIAGLTPEETVPATYRVWVYPVDLNDKGARDRDIAVGYGFMSWLGDVYSIIAIGLDGSIDISDDALTGYCPPCGRPAMIYSSASSRVYRAIPTGLINSVNNIYTITALVVSGSEEVFRNGQLLDIDGDYTVTYGATTTITLATPLMMASDTAPAEKLVINYST